MYHELLPLTGFWKNVKVWDILLNQYIHIANNSFFCENTVFINPKKCFSPPEFSIETFFILEVSSLHDRAVAQAVSRWLPTAAAWVRARSACGVCGGQSGTGAGFLRVLRFPVPIIPSICPSS
jgi:hypothetical protein